MKLHKKRFPNENEFYREARDQLLKAEIKLREQQEKVAAMRRQLPKGGKVPKDYKFIEQNADGETEMVRMSSLLNHDRNELVVYSLMFSADADSPCPSCTSIIDGLNGAMPHILQRVNMVVVATASPGKLANLKAQRGWNNIRLLSSANTNYNRRYHAETKSGKQLPACNVFRLTSKGNIRHSYNTELLYIKGKGEPRHVDAIWPIWNVLDLTHQGRGDDWSPALNYDEE